MSVKSAPLSPRMKLAWAGAAVLCAVVLILLWITAHQVKDRKLRARYGDALKAQSLPPVDVTLAPDDDPDTVFSEVPSGRNARVTLSGVLPPQRQLDALESARRHGLGIRFAIPHGATVTLGLPLDVSLEAEHFTLTYRKGSVMEIHDARARHVVDFIDLKESDLRRWQELEFTVDRLGEEAAEATLALRPGAPCAGAGRYLYLKPGLQIALSGTTSIRILAVDPVEPTVKLRVIEKSKDREVTVTTDAPLEVDGHTARVEGRGPEIALVVR